MLRQWVAVLVSLVLCAAALDRAGAAGAASPTFDPFRLYGDQIAFDVERDGEVIGEHVVTFTRTSDGIRVESRADVEVELLFLTAYRLRYQARELWRDGTLTFIEASTNDNGDYTRVQAVRDAAGLEISSPQGIYEAPPILPVSQWNAALLRGGQVLNTMTGELANIEVYHQGLDTVVTRTGSLRARHYLYSGDLNGEIWFDEEGRWVKLRFRANDGSIIDYVCRRCQAPTTVTTAE